MTHFDYLRTTPWNPTFEWVSTVEECAYKINSYHEDYPKYVDQTISALRTASLTAGYVISNVRLLAIHGAIFADKPFRGKFRELDVRVGLHHPPSFLQVRSLMDILETSDYKDVEDLVEWYKDFETVHPFQDGNGRVGGTIVAAHAHRLYRDKGWLAPNQ